MGGINFGWLAVWVPSPDWLCRILELCDLCQALRRSKVNFMFFFFLNRYFYLHSPAIYNDKMQRENGGFIS